jgi:hypothetical protein
MMSFRFEAASADFRMIRLDACVISLHIPVVWELVYIPAAWRFGVCSSVCLSCFAISLSTLSVSFLGYTHSGVIETAGVDWPERERKKKGRGKIA